MTKVCIPCAGREIEPMPDGTCPMCGESSWADVSPVSEEEMETAAETPQSKANRRGKR